jgi:hypothetical protein
MNRPAKKQSPQRTDEKPKADPQQNRQQARLGDRSVLPTCHDYIRFQVASERWTSTITMLHRCSRVRVGVVSLVAAHQTNAAMYRIDSFQEAFFVLPRDNNGTTM